MRDQKEYADTEGEVQMGTTRADGRRRLDEEAWELCDDAATVDEDQELAMRKTYREKHKSNLRPHPQVEQGQPVEWDRRVAVGCSHTIKADEVACGDS